MSDGTVILQRCIDRYERSMQNQQGEATLTNAFRLFHGRGQDVPGCEHMAVDWFGGHLLVTQYRSPEFDAAQLLQALWNSLPAVSATLQHRTGRRTETRTINGELPAEQWVMENGLKFWVRLQENQNVGLFLDMQPLRAWLQSSAAGSRVLNLFAFTCSLSVAAIAGGARQVVNNDMNRNVLAWGRRNHELNDQDIRQVNMLPHELFRSWGALKRLGPFDGIIIDPPTNQRGSFSAEKQYGLILKRLPDLLAPGAWIKACLNSPFLGTDFVPAQMARWCPAAHYTGQMPPSIDFVDRFPERALKISEFYYRP